MTDQAAAEAGLPPVDGYNLWPYLAGDIDTSPRTDVLLGTGSTEINGIVAEDAYVSASGRSVKLWKRLEGGISQAGWTGPECPNATYRTPGAGQCNPFCLFDLSTDPTEVSLSQQCKIVATKSIILSRTMTTFGRPHILELTNQHLRLVAEPRCSIWTSSTRVILQLFRPPTSWARNWSKVASISLLRIEELKTQRRVLRRWGSTTAGGDRGGSNGD